MAASVRIRTPNYTRSSIRAAQGPDQQVEAVGMKCNNGAVFGNKIPAAGASIGFEFAFGILQGQAGGECHRGN